jgi:hypothetical protein
MNGTLDLQRISNLGSSAERYQVRFEDAIGESFSAAMNKEELHDLLYHKLALDISNEDLDRSVDLLEREGRVTFPEIELKANEVAGAGLRFLEVEG